MYFQVFSNFQTGRFSTTTSTTHKKHQKHSKTMAVVGSSSSPINLQLELPILIPLVGQSSHGLVQRPEEFMTGSAPFEAPYPMQIYAKAASVDC